jgi:aminoglycoside phosphotransferase (APT) family kinase protein
MALINTLDINEAGKKLEKWLSRVICDGRPANIKSINVPHSSGMSALTLLVGAELDTGKGLQSKRLAIRSVAKQGGIFEFSDLEREFNLLSCLYSRTDVPIAMPYGFETNDESILGQPFLVVAAIDGRVPPDDPPYTKTGWVLDLSPQERRKLSNNGIQALAALHNVDVERQGLEWLGKTSADLPDMTDKLIGQRRYYEWTAKGQSSPLIEACFDWLETNKPAADFKPVISWGDSRLGNMIIADDLSVAAIIDWEMVGLGSPEVDLGHWIYTRRFHTTGIDAPLPEGFPSEEELVATYAEATGLQPTNLDYYIIFSALRMSISFMRMAQMMIDAGVAPSDTPMLTSNPALQLMADHLGLERPQGPAEYFAGNR